MTRPSKRIAYGSRESMTTGQWPGDDGEGRPCFGIRGPAAQALEILVVDQVGDGAHQVGLALDQPFDLAAADIARALAAKTVRIGAGRVDGDRVRRSVERSPPRRDDPSFARATSLAPWPLPGSASTRSQASPAAAVPRRRWRPSRCSSPRRRAAPRRTPGAAGAPRTACAATPASTTTRAAGRGRGPARRPASPRRRAAAAASRVPSSAMSDTDVCPIPTFSASAASDRPRASRRSRISRPIGWSVGLGVRPRRRG